MRLTTSLFPRFPGTMANFPGLSGKRENAPSGKSKRNPAFCFALSGPWQAKHLSDKMGLT